MSKTPTLRYYALIAAVVGVLALTAAACGSTSKSSTHMNPKHQMAPMHESGSAPQAAGAPSGSDCGMVPASGPGSFHGMAMQSFLAAAQSNPLLTTFASDINQAGLAGELNGMHNFTVFAPANDAFTKMPANQMTMMHSPTELAKIIKYHVVDGSITPAQIAAGKPLPTREGDTITPSKMGAVYELNTADVICGSFQTQNATVYIINQVLMPKH